MKQLKKRKGISLGWMTKGISTIEIVLIIVVLIALVLIFKDFIIDFVKNILNNISSQGVSFDPGTLAK